MGESILPRLARSLLLLWCGLGLWFSGERLLNPAVGWRPLEAEDRRGIVGLPLAESPSVSAIREVLARSDRGPGAWLIVYPPDIDEVSLAYVRSQLLHTEYPRLVEVITTAGRPRSAGYAGIITHPRVDFAGTAPALAEHRGFRSYPSIAR